MPFQDQPLIRELVTLNDLLHNFILVLEGDIPGDLNVYKSEYETSINALNRAFDDFWRHVHELNEDEIEPVHAPDQDEWEEDIDSAIDMPSTTAGNAMFVSVHPTQPGDIILDNRPGEADNQSSGPQH